MFTAHDAQQLAEQAFAGVMDRMGNPYIEHLRRVAAAVPDDCQVGAWLHDLIEDSDELPGDVHYTPELLLDLGVDPVDVQTIVLLTRVPGDGLTYMDRIRLIAAADGPAGRKARFDKRADLLDNLGRERPADMAGIERRYQRALAVIEQAMRNRGEL